MSMDNPETSNLPRLSIIIPAYQSQATLPECLRCLIAQTYRDSEIIVVDSDPDPTAHAFVPRQFPQVRYHYSAVRLLPHAARTTGARLARGTLLLFVDPDIYTPSDWVAGMVAAYDSHPGVIVSALKCYGNGWQDNGAHFCKFDSWLPGGEPRRIEIGPTAGLLCEKQIYETLGTFDSHYMVADTQLSWAFKAAGVPMWFLPQAVAAHHHTSHWGDILRERYARGREFGTLRVGQDGWGMGEVFRHSLISLIIPLRLVGLTWRGFRNAAAAGLAGSYVWHSPVAVSGEAAWLAGETTAYLKILTGGTNP
jgi:GT2 family glycosyltransferase